MSRVLPTEILAKCESRSVYTVSKFRQMISSHFASVSLSECRNVRVYTLFHSRLYLARFPLADAAGIRTSIRLGTGQAIQDRWQYRVSPPATSRRLERVEVHHEALN
jgi:hypothetical protein